MEVVFLQTADAVRYRRMLEITSQTALEYCARHGFQYESFVGIKRGYHPWHAAFNRIPLLARMVNDAFTGWVIYMDADAYVQDLGFDLRGYLADKGGYGFIAAPGGGSPEWSRVNNGIFMINLGHPDGRRIVRGWLEAFMAITDDALRGATQWDMVTNDQTLLQNFLHDRPELAASCLTSVQVAGVINSPQAQFIRQVLRAHATDGMEQRMGVIRRAVSAALGPAAATAGVPAVQDVRLQYEDFITALYRCLLLRAPDPGGFESGVRKLLQPGHGMAAEMRACLGSREFRGKAMGFLEHYLQEDDLRDLTARLAEKHAMPEAGR